MISSGDDTVKSISYPLLRFPILHEEDRQENTESDLELEVTQPATTKKSGRKSNKNKRESKSIEEKELGIQKNLEEALRKERKLGKNNEIQHKGTTSQTYKWGAPKNIGK
jgi:hypothetical protein